MRETITMTSRDQRRTWILTKLLVGEVQGSTDDLTGWAGSVARHLSRGTHRSLPGEWHGVADEVLAPALIAFFRED
jgi:hypothetical protein